jgi:hypothetical protein
MGNKPFEAEAVNPLVDGPSPKTMNIFSSGESGGASSFYSSGLSGF